MPPLSRRSPLRPRPSLHGGVWSVPALALALACTAPQPPAAPPISGEKRVSGAVVQIEPENRRLVVADAGQRFSIFYDDQTLVRSRTTPLSAADLRKGDRIVVSLDAEHEARARLITLAGPARTPHIAPTPSAAPSENPEEEEHP